MNWNDKLYNSPMAVAGRAKLAQDQETKRRQREFEENILPQLAADGLSQAAAMAVGNYFVKTGDLQNFDASRDIPNWKQLVQTPDEPEEDDKKPILPSPAAPAKAHEDERSVVGKVFDTLTAGYGPRLYDGAVDAATSLIGRVVGAYQGGEGSTAERKAGYNTASVARTPLEARLAEIEAGTATKTVVMPGMSPMDYGRPDTTEVPLSPAEAEREAADIRARLAEINKKAASGVYQAEQQRLREESKQRKEAAAVATQVAEGTEAKLPPSVARVTKNVGGSLTWQQGVGTVVPIAVAGLTRSPAATSGAAVLANIPQALAAFDSAYDTAVNVHHATHDEAAAYAGAVTAIEFGSEVTGSALGGMGTAGMELLGKFGGKASKKVLTEALEKTIQSRVSRFATGQALDAAGEVASNLGQHLLDVSLENTSYGDDAGQTALKQANKDFDYIQSSIDAAIGSVGVGAVPGAIGAHASYKHDVQQRDAKRTNAIQINEAEQIALAKANQEYDRRKAEEQRQKQQDVEAAYAQNEAASMSEQEKADQIEAGFQTMERDREAPTSRVERYADVVERVPVHPAAEITPEQVVAQREQAEKDRLAAEQLAKEQQRQRDEAEASARLDKAGKRITLEEKRKATAAKAAETNRRNALAEQVAREHADKTPQERVAILTDLINNPDSKPTPAAKKEQTPEERVQGVINQVEGLRKRTNTARANNKIRSLYKQDPTRTAQDIVNILDELEGAPQTTANEEIPTEEELRAKVAELSKKNPSLSMSAPVETAEVREQEAASDNKAGPVVPRTKEKQKQHEANVKALLQSMGNTQENVDIFNLVHQGKLILTDRPETVGREAKVDPAEFDTGSGKMYVYLDNFDPSKGKEVMLQAAAQHESGHAGQFNQRDGRNNLFRNLLGDKGNAAANKTIRDAAKSGNKLARAAVDRATEAAKANNSFTNVEDLELVPHLFSEAKIGNHAPGTIGKVIRDVKNAARAVTRKTLNKELDYSVDELAAAGSGVAGEIVKTDVQPADGNNGDLNMIYPVGTKAGDKEANLSRLYKSVDGREKYVLTDEGAKLKAGSVFRLLDSPNSGEQLKVDDLLAHDTLYDIMPEARNIPVVLDSSIKGFAAYDPNPDAKYISVHPDLLQGRTRTQVKEALLHEIQHYVQDHTGGEGQFFDERNIPGIKEHDKEVAAAAKVRTVASNAVLGNVAALTKNAPMSVKQRIPGIVTNHRIKDDAVKVIQLRQLLQMNGIYQEGEGAKLLAKWEAANREYHEIEAERRGVVNEHYMANINEREAFRTQLDSNKSQAELDVRGNPERAMRTQGKELDFGQRGDGRIDVPEGNGRIVALGDDPASMSDEKPVIAEMNRRHPQGSLAMAAPKKKDKAANPKFAIKERITRHISSSTQARLSLIKKAEALHSELVDAVHADTGKGRIAGFNVGDTNLPAEMDKDFSEFLSNHEHATQEGRAALIAALSKKYPESTKVLTKMRDLISDTTVDIVQDMVATGLPLSRDAMKSIGTMIAQKDHYMTRAFAAFQGVAGRKWAASRWTNFYNNIGKDISVIKNPKKRQDILEVRNGIKQIVSTLQIPTEDMLQDMTMDKLVSLADRHGIKEDKLQFDRAAPDATWLKRDELIGLLLDQKESYPEGRLEDMAMAAAKELMGLSDSGDRYAKQLSSMAKDPGTLNKREHIPLAIRKMLGEIELSPGQFLSTMGAQAALRARAKLVSDLFHDQDSNIAISTDDYYNLPEGVSTTNSTLAEVAFDRLNPRTSFTKQDYVPVSGKEWGALDGMYVRKEAYNRINESLEVFNTWGEAMKKFYTDPKVLGGKALGAVARGAGFANRWTKLVTVAGNPVNYMMQYAGSYLNLLDAGMIPITPRQMGRAGSAYVKGNLAAGAYFKSVWGTSLPPRLEEVQKYINIESVELGDIQRILGGKIEDYFNGTDSLEDATAKITKNSQGAGRTALKGMLAGYAIADNWSRLVAFYHRAAVLKDMYDAAGEKKTREEILTEAGHDTSLTTISPERAPKLVTQTEQAGLTQYAPYFSEVFRTRLTGFGLAFKDIDRASQLYKNGQIKAANILAGAGLSRLLGHTIATIGMPLVGTVKVASGLTAIGVSAATAAAIASGITALGGDDDENKLKRRLLPDTLKYQEIAYAGNNSMGYPAYVGISQKLDPSGPMTDILRIMAYADNDVQRAQELKNYATDNLLVFPQIWKDVWASIRNPNARESDLGAIQAGVYDGPALKQAFVEASGMEPATVDRFFNPLDNFIPGGARAWKSKYSPEDIQTTADEKRANQIWNAIGFRYETFDPTIPLSSFQRNSDAKHNENKASLNNNLVNIATATDKIIDDAVASYFTKEIARQVEDYQNVKSLRSYGFKDDQIEVLLTGSKYSKEYAKQLIDGLGNPEISLSGIVGYAQNSRRYDSPKDREIARVRAKTVVNKLLSMEAELNERGVSLDKTRMPKGWND